ncbi:MAG: hypothetical protein CBD29_05585 [Synechococcus sp. TMED169]|nr:MAG: hypothetical protein CBD29_05585 [Synechococcus sp. TMED169]
MRFLAVTREPGAPLLSEVLDGASAVGRWQVACGPEGGWTPEERQVAADHGWQPVSLGPSILRASTAAISALALMQHQRQRLSAANCPPSP